MKNISYFFGQKIQKIKMEEEDNDKYIMYENDNELYIKKISNKPEYKMIDLIKNIKIDHEWKNITYLKLNNLNLHGEIPDSIYKMINLSRLKLSRNNLSGSIKSHIIEMKKLKSLDLSYNKFSGYITPYINILTQLKRLWLNDNKFNDLNKIEDHIISNLISYNFQNKLRKNNSRNFSLKEIKKRNRIYMNAYIILFFLYFYFLLVAMIYYHIQI